MLSHSRPGPNTRAVAVSALFLLLTLVACSRQADETLAQAYVAPASANLRSQLNQKNSTIEVLKHGDRVMVLDVRRRYVKVRTAKGAEGWLDSVDLLNPADMQRVRRQREDALLLPPQGIATAYETLNIHLDPSRKSPAFAQIPEGGPVSVLAHKNAAKDNGAPRSSLFVDRSNSPARKQRRDRSSKPNSKQPPMPRAPKPPANSEELWGAAERPESTQDSAEIQPRAGQQAESNKPAETSKPVILESWTLVRTKTNQIGWVLSRNLMMAIPDEVAQYAEGKHITSYFELGAVNDEAKGPKHNWLWTTESGTQPFDFDSWRVFLWNRRRHRYETSYRQRDVEGYFPIQVDPPDPTRFGRTFKLITKDDDRQLRRRTYLFDGARVHLIETEDYRPDAMTSSKPTAGVDGGKLLPSNTGDGWLKRKWNGLKQRLLPSR